MKKIISIITICIIAFASGSFVTKMVYSSVDGITSENYLDYEKPNRDTYGYNKGECEKEYLSNEEYFYNEYYDHWNVDKIYDEEIIEQDTDNTSEQEVIIEEETSSVCPTCGQPIE